MSVRAASVVQFCSTGLKVNDLAYRMCLRAVELRKYDLSAMEV